MLPPLRRALLALAVAPLSSPAQSGLVSSTATVALSATQSSQLSVTINSGSTQSIATLTDGALNPFASPVNVTTAWNLHPSTSAVVVVAYFATPASALASGANLIASSRVQGRVGTAGAFAAFTGNAVAGGASTAGVAGGTLQLFSQAILGNNRNSSRTDDLWLRLDLTGTTTVPGTYTGTLTLRAITQ